MTKITPNWKSWTIVVLLVFLTISVLFIHSERRARLRAEKEAEKATTDLNAVVKDIKRTVDKDGREHVVFPTNQNVITREMAKESKKLDVAAAIIGIKTKDIIEYGKTSLSASATGLKATVGGTKKRPTYSYKDSTFEVGLAPVADTTKLDYEFSVLADIDLVSTSYRKRNIPLIGAYKYYTDVYATDPRVTIRGLEKLTISQNKPTFAVRVQASTLYGLTDRAFFGGPGVQVDINKTALTYNYYYSYFDRKWIHTAGARFDIIRF